MARLRSIVFRYLLLLSVISAAQEDGDGDGDGSVELGPRLPGDSEYWLRLRSLSFSEGKLEPQFDGKGHDFTLTIENPEVKSFIITVELDLKYYDLLALPRIEVDGKVIEVSPLNTIVVPVLMNSSIGPEDKIVSIKLMDPSGKGFGGFLGFGAKPRDHEYRIRCLQPPEFQNVVKISDLQLKLQDGKMLEPTKSDVRVTGQYWYTLPAEETGAYVKATCGPFATTVTVNGLPVPSGQDFWVDMEVPHVTWLVECLYQNARWSTTSVGRTYQVHMKHLKDVFEKPQVRMMSQDGQCEDLETDDTSDEDGFYCRSARHDLRMIVTYDTSSVEVFLNKGDKEENIPSGIPVQVIMPADTVDWFLRVKGMKEVKVPLRLVKAMKCTKMMCPSGWAPKPALNAGENAVLHLCHSQTCTTEDDSTRCCREAGTPCQDFGLAFGCPSDSFLFDMGFCHRSPCVAQDHRFCCQHIKQDQEEQQFDMTKGEWKEWFERTDTSAEKIISGLGDRVDFAITMKVKDSKNPEETAKVMKEQVAKHVSVPTKDVTVAAEPAPEGKANFFVQVKSLGGEKKTDDMLAKVNSLLKGTALVDSIKADLQKRGKPDHTLGVTYTSKVEKKIAPKPHLAFDMIIQVSKSADMGGNGNEEELSPEVHAALKKAFLSLADVPDKEKFDMAFKKIRNSAMPNAEVPEGDELVRVAGNITLPRGKEGSKEILAAKLKSGTVAKQINKHMQKEVLKSENNPDARIVGGKKDYKVYSVDFSGMSKMPHGLPSVDTNLVPTTTTSHGLHASKEEILKTWLSMTTTSTTLARIEGPALIRTAAGLCLMATPGRQLGLRPQIASCDRADGHQGWFYSRVAKTVQSVFGLCLAADLNGPAQSPGWQLDTSAQVLQSWVAQRGEGPVNQWACNGHWQQQFSYEPATGQFQILGSSMPGLCLEAKQADMMVALCNPSSFAQQFWLEKVPASSFMPSHINKAEEAPIFMKPYFDGEVAMKSADNTYDSFTLSPFARKRAAFYLTQGCSPVPTYSCGTPVPDMPNVYVGESLLKVGAEVDQVPWMSAVAGSPVKMPGKAKCFYDNGCKTESSASAQLEQWKNGCNAGGKPMCRYCGNDQVGKCPEWFKCADGGLEKGFWTEDQKQWCCEKFSIGCDPPYSCSAGLQSWKTWDSSKKAWCCSYQMLACEDECAKTDPATFRENHDTWCATFGNNQASEKKEKKPSKFELMVMQMYEARAIFKSQPTGFVLGLAMTVVLGATVCRFASSSRTSRSAEEETLI